MKIGIIGAGNIGGTLTRRLAALGHEVFIANSRGPETLRELAAETGATAVSVTEAARDKDVVVITIPEKTFPTCPTTYSPARATSSSWTPATTTPSSAMATSTRNHGLSMALGNTPVANSRVVEQAGSFLLPSSAGRFGRRQPGRRRQVDPKVLQTYPFDQASQALRRSSPVTRCARS
jgi:threonine dehydrogenase-like Zn-dependent dehydrogenase